MVYMLLTPALLYCRALNSSLSKLSLLYSTRVLNGDNTEVVVVAPFHAFNDKDNKTSNNNKIMVLLC